MGHVAEDPPSDRAERCSVAEAATRLNCSEQTVRNLIKNGELSSSRVRRGRREDIHQVLIASIDEYITRNGPFQSRPSRAGADDRAGYVRDLEERVQRLENQSRGAGADQVNLQYANLRLMEIQEGYERALQEMLVADDHRRAALSALQQAAAEYRAILQQFHLPSVPPDA
jgi:excisionase family DNA binding protein